MAKKKASRQNKRKVDNVPPMYPDPEPIDIGPVEIHDVDLESRTVTLKGPPPQAFLSAAAHERLRTDLNYRLVRLLQSCKERVIPFLGARIKSIPQPQWIDHETGLSLIRESDLVQPSPEARDAFLAMQTIHRIVSKLATVNDYPDEIEQTICLAIDLGQLLQRSQTQIDFGEMVDLGKRNKKSSQDAAEAKRQDAIERMKPIKDEFDNRVKNAITKPVTEKAMKSILKAMGQEHENDRLKASEHKNKFGHMADFIPLPIRFAPHKTLDRWAREYDWFLLTPTE